MKVEHLTIGGNSVTRDTGTILPETGQLLAAMKIAYKSDTIKFPDTPLTKGWRIKITATPGGAMFDVMKNNDIVAVNFCSFGKVTAATVKGFIAKTISSMPSAFGLKNPDIKTDVFIATMLVNPFVFSPPEFQTLGEVELYIYNELFIAFSEKQN